MLAEDGMTLTMFEAKFFGFHYTEAISVALRGDWDRLFYRTANPVCILYQNRHNAMPQTHRNVVPRYQLSLCKGINTQK